jgi:putative membrane protein
MKKAILIILWSLGGLTVKAQIPQPDPDTTAKHFLIVASIGNLQEISAAELAVKKGKSADVRSFARMMIDDHGKAEQQLLEAAKSRGISLPAAATGGIQPDLNLKNAGDDFDQRYVHAMVVNHAGTVQAFENYATTGKDPAVRAFAQQLMLTLKTHLAKIKSIEGGFNEPAK